MSNDQGRDQRQVRIAKLERLRDAGINPYPERFERTHDLKAARALPEGTEGVAICGRLMTLRVMGKLSFATLQDQSGRCQIGVKLDAVGEELYKKVWKKLVDIGDHIGIVGTTMVTKTGEPTVMAQEFHFLGKTLRPLPEKFHGLVDVESCYRQRYLDLIMNPESAERFRLRGRIIRGIRQHLEENGFDEVETPILVSQASGAHARPFFTHHNALDMEVTLRIAPETYLKRLIAGGCDRVFEFARCFRNEGMDPSHLQDFTMLEWYASWWNYEDNMRYTQELIQHVLESVMGSLEVEIGGETVDFSGEWPRVSFAELIQKDAGIDITQVRDKEALLAAIKSRGLDLSEEETAPLGYGNLLDLIYKRLSRPKLGGPLFLTSHPVELSPLARRSDTHEGVADRFQLVVRGWEIVNAYSELVDPLDQRERLQAQASLKAEGDEEAMELDEDYLVAMEHGMPPISGFGMGIDRLVTLLAGQDNLRDVVYFPLMKPQLKEE